MSSHWHIVVSNDGGTVVGQFDVRSERRRKRIHDSIPDDLSVSERSIPGDMAAAESLDKLSNNTVQWDDRVESL